MRNYLPLILLVLSSVASLLEAQTNAAGNVVELFDGKTLDGWAYDTNYWRAENGAIVGEIPPGQTLNKNTWIVWQDGMLRDFDLRLQVKLTGAPAANSGIQIRCQVENVDHVSGYQADLDQGATWLGRIYDELGRALLVERGQRVRLGPEGRRQEETFAPPAMYATIFREHDWNDYRIVGVGPRITVFVNGTLFADLVDEDPKAHDLIGKLAFQLHSGPETRVEFRNILLERLGADDSRLGTFAWKSSLVEKESTEPAGFLPTDNDGENLNLDFETGDLTDWTATGSAFQGQPVQRDTIGSRWTGQVSSKQGRFFVGGYELSKSDRAQGTLTSPWFSVTAPYASFLIAGGSSPATRVDIIAKEVAPQTADEPVVIASASGKQREQMQRVVVDLRDHQNRQIAVRLIDESSGGWGHLNFDDFRFHTTRPPFADEPANDPLQNPLLHHLRPNPNPSPLVGNTLATMSVPDGFAVDLIAAEPEVHQPMAFTFDAKGRLWVVEGHSYPTKRAAGEGLDKILIFEDANLDGSYETRKIFIDGLNLVSGMQVGHGGVWVGAAPQLLFIPDRNHDDRPDGPPQILLDGFGYADTHETINSLTWGPDGWLYGNQGVFNQSHIGKSGTPKDQRVQLSAGVWRYHPTRHEFEVFAHGGSNQWGLDFDDHGQLFMTHCRSYFGRGATTHVIQGGHYWNQTNSRHAPFIAAAPVPGISTMPNYLLASARYGHGEGGAGKPGSQRLYGGHSHVGTMIYLGDNWPRKYRNHLFTHNLHGHRINHQINRRQGSGYNTIHAGYDVFHCADPQYIGVDLQYGPDGAVYISDWYDPRHCHSPRTEQWQRGNGRMYRMRYGRIQPMAVNYWEATDIELARAQLHANDWHVRMARLTLAERAAAKPIDQRAVNELKSIVRTSQYAAQRLRGLWCLHVTGALDGELARQCLGDESEYVRAWTVQLLAESDRIPGRDELLKSMLEPERSALVNIYLASAAGRLRNETSWQIVEALAQEPDTSTDRNLPLLLWQVLAELLPGDPYRAEKLIDTTQVPAIRQYLQWYLPRHSNEMRERLLGRIARLTGQEQLESLRLMAAGLANARNLQQPPGWRSLAEQFYRDPTAQRAAETLGTVFGDARLFSRMRTTLEDPAISIELRQRALEILADDSNSENLPPLLRSVDVPELQVSVIHQLRKYPDPSVAKQLLKRLPQLDRSAQAAALETLCSRITWSAMLLDAVEQETVDKALLSDFYVRQMLNLGSQAIRDRLRAEWGAFQTSSANTKRKIKSLAEAYRTAPLWAYDARAGAVHFEKQCATCHVESENSPRIGPKLEGTGAKGIAYIVENVVDPHAVVGKDFQTQNIVTTDGRVIAGVVLEDTTSSLKVRTATAIETIAKDEIDEIVVSEKSLMPDGLLDQLNEQEQIELLKYLMSLK